MDTIPTSKATILRFIEKGIVDPTFAPVHLTAKLSAVDANSVKTDIVRAGESLWHGRTCHGKMQGEIKSYPTIDLSLFPWTCSENVSFKSVRNGELYSDMQKQLDETLASLPFQMRPIDDTREPWQNAFIGEEPLNRYFYFELFREDGVPEWITGLDTLQMSGSWGVFLPNPSPEMTLVDQIITYERRAAELARLKAAPAISISVKENEVNDLQQQIEESVRHVAA